MAFYYQAWILQTEEFTQKQTCISREKSKVVLMLNKILIESYFIRRSKIKLL